MKFEFENDGLNKLAEAVRRSGRSIKQEVAAACNATARGMKVPMSREIRKTLAAPAKAVKETVKQTAKASKQRLVAAVGVERTERLSLKEFKPKQGAAGVTATVIKGQGRRLFPGAFMGPKPGAVATRLRGHVFRRVGKDRLPITKIPGLSPHRVFIYNRMDKPMVEEAEKRLKAQIERRIQYNIFKANQLS